MATAFIVAARTRWPESGWSGLLESWHFAEQDFTYITGPEGIALVLVVAALLYRAGQSGESAEEVREG